MNLDPVNNAVLKTIEGCGYTVTVRQEGQAYRLTATECSTGERFIVTSADLDTAAVELAQQVGIELEDG